MLQENSCRHCGTVVLSDFQLDACCFDQDSNVTLDGSGKLPTLMQRLHIIAKAILADQSFEPLLIRYADFASELQKKTEATF
jgi:hypothetical protein